ncbi:hypothetical protein Prudu_005424, partial [Prunus dulcis]
CDVLTGVLAEGASLLALHVSEHRKASEAASTLKSCMVAYTSFFDLQTWESFSSLQVNIQHFKCHGNGTLQLKE